MIDLMVITLEKITVAFFFLALGYLLAQLKMLPDGTAKALSVLGTKVFFPCYLIKNLSKNFTVDMLSGRVFYILFGCAFLAVTLLLASVLAHPFGKSGIKKKTLMYIFSFANYGYFGYPIIEHVFGAAMVSDTIVMALPFTVSITSIGYAWLTETLFHGKSLLKLLVSPPILAIAVGGTLGLCNVSLPHVVSDIVTTGNACMFPVSMILSGVVLGGYTLGSLFADKVAYVISAVRVLAIPALVGSVLYLCGARGAFFAIPVLITAMPVGMNAVMFPESMGINSGRNARVCFISYLFAAVAVPFVFAVVEKLA